jgi:hypothetical protein
MEFHFMQQLLEQFVGGSIEMTILIYLFHEVIT